MKYKIQIYDTDCECWEDADIENNSFNSKFEAQAEARHESNKCSYPLKTRVIEDN